MGDVEERKNEQRQKAIDELRSLSVGRLIQIVDRLGAMDLSASEIENILRTCGLNDDCAMRFGAYIKAEKGKNGGYGDRPIHPR